jgi:hypothetical protein
MDKSLLQKRRDSLVWGAVQFLEMTDRALARGTNMDEQNRQDGVHVSFRSAIVGEFCANLLVEERSLTRTK